MQQPQQPVEMVTEETMPACPGNPSDSSEPQKKEQTLPKLTPQEFKIYNRMAEHMNYFHNHFRETWNILHGACVAGRRPSGMSLRTFLSTGEQFCHALTIHHSIEEQHIFPVLARRMPAFERELALLTQHREIHAGLEKFEAYLGECRRGERELRWDELRALMDGFGEVLWAHLDDEVRELGAENMRKFWSVEEMKRLPM